MRATKTTWNSRYSDPNIASAILSAITISAIFDVANGQTVDFASTLAFGDDDVVSGDDVTSGDDVSSEVT